MNAKEKLLKLIRVLAEAIREAGTIPEGHLYAAVMNYLTLEEFQVVLAMLVEADLVSVKNNEVTWTKAS